MQLVVVLSILTLTRHCGSYAERVHELGVRTKMMSLEKRAKVMGANAMK